MRAPKPFGALVAGSLFALTRAQANTYGDPNGNGFPNQNGNPDGWQPPSGNGAPLPSGNPGDWQSPGGSGNAPSQGSGTWSDSSGISPSANSPGNWPSGNGAPADSIPGTSEPGDGNGIPPVAGNSAGSGSPGDWQNPDGSNFPSSTGVSGNWPQNPNCVMQGTTTIFVTILPSSPAQSYPSDTTSPGSLPPNGSSADGTSGDGSSPDGPYPAGTTPDGSSPSAAPPYDSPDGINPDGSVPEPNAPGGSDTSPSNPESNGPTESGTNPPADAGQVLPGSVKPFTTLTIDIWGTGNGPATLASDSSPQATSEDSGVVTDAPAPMPSAPSDSGPQGPEGDPGTAPPSSPDGSTGTIPEQPGDSMPVPMPAGSSVPAREDPNAQSDAGSPSNPNDSSYGQPDQPPIFVTDGQPGPSGVSFNLPPLPQTTSLSNFGAIPSGSTGSPADGNQNGDAPYSVTIIGPDGLPTIVSHPWGHDPQAGDEPTPGDAYTSDTDAQTVQDPVPAGGTMVPSVPTTANGPGGAGNTNADDSGAATCVTIIGADGKPTVVDYTVGVPSTGANDGPATKTALTDGSALAQSMTIIGSDGKPTVVIAPWGNPNSAGETEASPSMTIIGADGKPTVVHSPWEATSPPITSIPFTTSAPVRGTGENGNEGGDGGVATSDAQLPDGVTTCVTVLGSDGKPTVVDWPWHFPDAPGGLSSIATAVASSGGLGNDGSGNGDIGVVTEGSALPQTAPMTHASFTILGSDGLPTIAETTWVPSPTGSGSGPGQDPVFSQASLSGLPSGVSVQLPNPSNLATGGVSGPGDGIATCFTVIGADGKPTIVETTLPVPDATGGPVIGPGATLLPPSSSGILPGPLPPFPDPASQIMSNGGVIGNPNHKPYTTCTSYTVLGPDGLPTVIDTTWVVPPSFETGSALATDSSGLLSAPAGQITVGPVAPVSNGAGGITTCSTYTMIGLDGLPSVVETTFVVPAQNSGALPTDVHLTSGIQAAPWSAASGGPAPPSAGGFVPSEGAGPSDDGLLTTCITVMTTGTDGALTPVEQTIILPPSSAIDLPPGLSSALPLTTAGLPGASPSGPVLGNGGTGPGDDSGSNISGYNGDPSNGDAGTVLPPSGPILSGASVDPLTAGEPTLTVTGTRTLTKIVIADPSGGPMVSGPSGLPLSDYVVGDGAGDPSPVTAQPPGGGPGAQPSEATLFPAGSVAYGNANPAGATVTSTWSNKVPDGTTTHLLKFPLTTLATLPVKRALRRQFSSPIWGNSTATASSPSHSHTESRPSPTMCASGGNIGNRTVNFDSEKAGPLFNPSNDLWFSEGFLIAPPSSQEKQSYFASSGGQLIEFVPAALTPNLGEEGSDVAEIGVGPNAPKGCYRFDLFGASLGCAAEGTEEWCEFEISAYRWNPESAREEPIDWSETKRVPACANFPAGACALTPVEFDGYTDITGILITLRVGLDLRAWWGDDFRYGWTDNSCEAATCRSSAAAHRVKRETVETALRRGVWHWTPEGVERLDDDFIWDAVQ